MATNLSHIKVLLREHLNSKPTDPALLPEWEKEKDRLWVLVSLGTEFEKKLQKRDSAKAQPGIYFQKK